MPDGVTRSDVIGLARSGIDVHVLGVARADELLRASGFSTVVAEPAICDAFGVPQTFEHSSLIRRWVVENRVTVLCFSYRLDPEDAVLVFGRLMYQLENRGLREQSGGPIRRVFFAGLPTACDAVEHLFRGEVGVFRGDESPRETLSIMGIDPSLAPETIAGVHPYDASLLSFGRDIAAAADYGRIEAVDRQGSSAYGTSRERVVHRILHGRRHGLPPLIRAHAGPYLDRAKEAVELFTSWCGDLAEEGLLDILSIGTSQLTQERFGESWDGRPNGGGVPVNSALEYRRIWKAARPMLVRTYAGTRRIVELAAAHEETLHIAWHALSLWWFCQLDGRGPNSVAENLQEHFEVLRMIAATGKPYEPNVPHQFAFRGADDISYVVSAVLAARVAKRLGIRDLILQIMMNDPKYTWGVKDLAKARATLELVRELEDGHFRVFLQTRAGLDYFSSRMETAKAQLAAVTALMDDLEPRNPKSPDIVHVVSYSEGSSLATPRIINDSIRITRHALDTYRGLRAAGKAPDMSADPEARERQASLVDGARQVLSTIEACVSDPYTPRGLYDVLRLGFLPIPGLMHCREEFPEAVNVQTKVRAGQVDVYEGDRRLEPAERMARIKERETRR